MSAILIEATGDMVVDGRLAEKLSKLPLDREYREIRVVYPDGSTEAKPRRQSTQSRTARNAMRSFMTGNQADKRRRELIVSHGKARIEIHFME